MPKLPWMYIVAVLTFFVVTSPLVLVSVWLLNTGNLSVWEALAAELLLVTHCGIIVRRR